MWSIIVGASKKRRWGQHKQRQKPAVRIATNQLTMPTRNQIEFAMVALLSGASAIGLGLLAYSRLTPDENGHPRQRLTLRGTELSIGLGRHKPASGEENAARNDSSQSKK